MNRPTFRRTPWIHASAVAAVRYAALVAAAISLPVAVTAHLAVIRQGPESAGLLEAGDNTGHALASGDFNGDTFEDLAIGAPTDSIGPLAQAGAVVVVYGSARGLTHEGAVLRTAASIGFSDQDGAWFGAALAAADVNGDGIDDLAIGAPFRDESGLANSGAVFVLAGSGGGLAETGLHFNQADLGGLLEAGDEFGGALAAGAFDDDPYDDLAIGSPGEDADAGAVSCLPGSMTGPDAAAAVHFKQSDLGGTDNGGDRFGSALAVAQIAGGLGQDDLVAGAPFREIGALINAGAVYLIRGSPAGLTASFAAAYDANDFGPLQAMQDGHFGLALAAGRFSSSNFAWVAIGEPRRTLGGQFGAGRVLAVPGSAGGLDFSGALEITQPALGLPAEFGDDFGFALAAGDQDLDGRMDLAIGAPGDGLDTVSTNSGVVHLLFGSDAGLTFFGDKQYWQRDAGDADEDNDRFGSALVFGAFDNTNRANLAIGAPKEDSTDDVRWKSDGTHFEKYANAGAVYVVAPWRQPQTPVRCRQSVALDCDDAFVYTQRPFDRVRIASTTKVMTLLVAAEAIQAGSVDSTDEYTIPAWLADPNNVTGGRKTPPSQTGERYTLIDMMHMSYSESFNDITYGIADQVTGGANGWQGQDNTVAGFVAMMNAKAAALGMTNTLFTNPAGRPWGDPYSTPADMAKLMRAALQNDLLRDLMNDNTWTVRWFTSGGALTKTTYTSSFDALDQSFPKAIAYKPGGNDPSQRTGIFAAREGVPKTVVAGAYGWRRSDPALPFAPRVEDMANLLALAFEGCNNAVLVPPPPPPGPTLTMPNVPTGPGEKRAAGAPGAGAGAANLDVVVLQQENSGTTALRLRVSRSSEGNVGAGLTRRYGFSQTTQHDGVSIVNTGESTATLQIVVSHPPSTTTVVLGPDAFFDIGPFAGAAPVDWQLDITNLDLTPATLAVQENGYQTDVTGSGTTWGDVLFTGTLQRGGDDSHEDWITLDTVGFDRSPGNTVFLRLQTRDLPTDAGDPPPAAAPRGLVLHPNVPNPFNPRTTLRYTLAAPQPIDLRILDVRGRLVRVLVSGTLQPAGPHHVLWDGRDGTGRRVASGLYVVRLRSGDVQRSRRIVLVQ